MEINAEVMDILLAFVFTTSAIRKYEKGAVPRNLRFIFKDEDINLFEKLIRSRAKEARFVYSDKEGYFLYDEDIKKVLSSLRRNLNEYLNRKDDNIQYIYIDDTVRFATLLYELANVLNDKSDYFFRIHSVLSNVWIRMSASEFDNVYKFLERQILFAKHTFETEKQEYFCSFKGFDVHYRVSYQHTYNETNNNLSFRMYSEKYGVRDEDGCYRNQYCLGLPDVHFQVLSEGDKKTCYIYAIQDDSMARECEWYFSDRKKAEENSLLLKNVKKELRNKYVNYRFILALKFFVEMLRENNIYDIKVPLLQIFNYDYHVEDSKYYKQIMERIEEDETIDKSGDTYEWQKKLYDRYVDKEDLISKNKTERLVGTFMVLEEKFRDIEILSEPFIQDENLIVKILQPKKSQQLIKKNKGGK